MIWCRQRTNSYLEARQSEALDRLASEEGISRAKLIRRLLDSVMAGTDRSLESDLEAIESPFAALADVVTPDREPDARATHLDRM